MPMCVLRAEGVRAAEVPWAEPVAIEIQQLHARHATFMHRLLPQHFYELDELPVRHRGVLACDRFRHSADRGNRRAVVTQHALEVRLLLFGSLGVATGPQLAVDRRGQRSDIELHTDDATAQWQVDPLADAARRRRPH